MRYTIASVLALDYLSAVQGASRSGWSECPPGAIMRPYSDSSCTEELTTYSEGELEYPSLFMIPDDLSFGCVGADSEGKPIM